MKISPKLFWIYALNSSIYFLQGIGGIASLPLSYYLKETLHLSASNIMYISAVVSMAWCLKPLIGFCIDNVGWQKRTWILYALAADILGAIFLGTMYLPLGFLVTTLMLTSWTTAWRDVAVDGIMVVEGKSHRACGRIQSIQWISVTIAGALSTLLGAWIAEKNFPYQVGFLAMIPLYLIGVFTVYKYVEKKTRNKIKVYQQSQAIQNFKKMFTHKNFLIVCLFIFLYKYSPSFGTPLWYLERDQFHWSKMFIGTLGAVSSLISILGAMLYYKFEPIVKCKKYLLISIILGATTSLLYLYFTPVTDIIYTIVFSIAGMFFHLIIMTVMAENCLKGLESTSFAFLCSVSNIAATCSSLSGAWLLPRIGLPPLIVVSAMTSLLCLTLFKYIHFKK